MKFEFSLFLKSVEVSRKANRLGRNRDIPQEMGTPASGRVRHRASEAVWRRRGRRRAVARNLSGQRGNRSSARTEIAAGHKTRPPSIGANCPVSPPQRCVLLAFYLRKGANLSLEQFSRPGVGVGNKGPGVAAGPCGPDGRAGFRVTGGGSSSRRRGERRFALGGTGGRGR